jgi:hypothetical protein
VSAESPAQGRAPADARDVGTESTEERGRAEDRRYDASRYAPVNVALWQRFPPSSLRAFAITASLGQLVDVNGNTDRLANGRQAAGAVVRRDRLPAILAAIGTSDRTFRRHVQEWVERFQAHRCSPRMLTLFTQPEPARCPGCQVEIVYDHVPRRARRQPGARDAASGRILSARLADGPGRKLSEAPDGIRPVLGRNPSAAVAEARPLLSTAAPHRSAGLLGEAVGAEPCPECGARSSAVGYWGHGVSCPRFYSEAVCG